MTLTSLEAMSLRMAVELQQQELEALAQYSMGKQNEEEQSDLEKAFEIYNPGNERPLDSNQGLDICRSTAGAAHSDGQFLRSLLDEERQAREDRALALALSGVPSSESITSNAEVAKNIALLEKAILRGPGSRNIENTGDLAKKNNEQLDENLLRQLEAIGLRPNRAHGCPGEKSAQGGVRGSPEKPLKTRVCAICTKSYDVAQVVLLPCSHGYCNGCLKTLVELSFVSEAMSH
ncbi:hypothetical protein HIM_02223 [Hirsutella minnesotensis 3608]|nr:hypothetical protein HIM_02223 [Hirsutella minnesotensis 3608]